MALAARRVQQGELFNPGIAMASEELNELGEALTTAITRLQAEDRTLTEILAALPAGVALFAGRTCVFRNAPMDALALDAGRIEGLPDKGTLPLGDRLLQFQKVRLPADRRLFIASDITAEVASQKLKAFADITRIVAHEVKNPLTPIRLSVEYLRDLAGKDPARFRAESGAVLKEVLDSVDDLEKAALEFSDFARLPTLKKERIDLAEVLEAWLMPFTASGRVTFLPTDVPAVADIDPRLFKRALFNLLNNAWQSASPPPPTHVTLGIAEHIEIHVTDEGPGVEPESRAHLFEPYFTTKTSGTGLGLMIARKIAEEHGGSLDLLPDGDRGLHFVLSLPKADPGSA
jgi:nitrogen fixation/metabolism regulation signal transduction histidine kinase